MNKIKYLLISVSCFVMVGCASPAHYSAPASNHIKPAKQRVNLDDTKKVKQLLKKEYAEWQSVRHSMGGMSKRGIDCSGYVYKSFLNRFGIEIPRSTELQSEVGRPVKQAQLKPGDLVFFKTGLFKKHVGIYLEDRRFVHVSASKGVTVSSLDNSYWAGNYWQARRIR
ncbi:MAG: NlpC/P60 family protein [Gammaproteobacteria bacterium]|nr:NlpC/P60 family protein [Gammaproteobacteria bacterium]